MLLRTALLSLALVAQAQEVAPLPSADAVLAAFRAKSEAEASRAQSYSYLERTTTRVLDSKDKVKEEKAQEYEVTPTSGHPIKRLVKVDGKPLSEQEAAKEDARVMKEAEKAGEEEAKGKRINLRKLAEFCEVTNLRRGERNGAPVLLLDFRPKAKARTTTQEEEMLSKLAGTLTLDEATKDALSMEAHLTKSMSFGLLVSLQEGSAFTQDFQRINGEVTLPAHTGVHFEGRVFFSHMRMESESQYSDFRKFGMEAGTTKDTQILPKGK